MRISLVFFIFIFSLQVKAQNNYLGEWNDYWGGSLNIKSDSTFNFTWAFDLIVKWSNGVWFIKNDTIFFKVIPIYDTLKYSAGYSLVLSEDKNSQVLVPNLTVEFSSNSQDSSRMPTKLFFHRDRLYIIGNRGELIKKKVKGWVGKWHLWYLRKEKYYKK